MKKLLLFAASLAAALSAVEADAADAIVHDTPITGDAYYGSPDGVVLRGSVRVSAAGELEIEAAGPIEFEPGFSIEAGGQMTARMGVGDTDGDGLSDMWETFHFQDLATSDGAATDTDQDGDTDLLEWQMASDPGDATSRSAQFVQTAPIDNDVLPLPADGEPVRVTVLALGLTDGDEIRIIDQFGNDITGHASVSGSGLELVIDPEDLLDPDETGASEHLSGTTHTYDVVIRRNGADIVTDTLAFTVDAVPPTVTASEPAGRYVEPLGITLAASEQATIYYSLDNSYPIAIYDGSVVTVSGTTLLRAFAEDVAGNRGPLVHVLYEFDELPGPVSGLAAVAAAGGDVDCSWTASGEAAGYFVYRAVSAFDRQLLEASLAANLPPPTHLRTTATAVPAGQVTLTDAAPPRGVTLSYAATVVTSEEVEGPPSPLVDVVVPAIDAATREEAVGAALAYLEAGQGLDGGWGAGAAVQRLIATSQVLRALEANDAWASEHSLAVERGLRFVAGRFADDNDAIARSIDALKLYDLRSPTLDVRLAFRGHQDGGVIVGWGAHQRYYSDPLHSALGLLVSDAWGGSSGLPAQNVDALLSATLLQAADLVTGDPNGRYGWVPQNRDSIFVSALVYHALGQTGSYQWMLNEQGANGATFGSFRDSSLDTAAALLWLPLDETQRTNAEAFLVDQQDLDGSWGGDAFLTGLCLEALTRPRLSGP